MIDRPRVGILASGDRWHVQALSAALARLGCEAVPLPAARLTGRAGPGGERSIRAGEVDLESLDGVLVRFIPPRVSRSDRVPDGRPARGL